MNTGRPFLVPRLASLAIFFLAFGLAATASADCDFRDELEATLDASGAKVVMIKAQAGDLEVVGRDGLDQVVVRGTACASSAKLLDGIRLDTDRRGERVEIETVMPDKGGHDWGRRYAYVDLVVEMPSSLIASIKDGSGDLRVRGTAGAEIRDGSGGIEIEDIGGDLVINDGSGDIEARNIAGEVRIEDGSGDVEIVSAGIVVIEDDGSGDLRIRDIDGDVLVRSDGSGSISVATIGGDFTVERDGSGGVSHRDVGGRVSVPSDR